MLDPVVRSILMHLYTVAPDMMHSYYWFIQKTPFLLLRDMFKKRVVLSNPYQLSTDGVFTGLIKLATATF